MIVASFIACQRTSHQVPHVLSCRALSVSMSWFYKWKDRAPTARQLRRRKLDEAVKAVLRGVRAHLWLPEGARGPGRRRLGGLQEDRRSTRWRPRG